MDSYNTSGIRNSRKIRDILLEFEESWHKGIEKDIDKEVELAKQNGIDEWELKSNLIPMMFELQLKKCDKQSILPSIEDYTSHYPFLSEYLAIGVLTKLVRIELNWKRDNSIQATETEYIEKYPKIVGFIEKYFAGLDLTEAPEIIDYKLLGIIGNGGFGTVYRAKKREGLERTVALKVLTKNFADGIDILKFEAEKLARIDHENIVKIFDVGRTKDGKTFFTMELLDQGSLKELIINSKLKQHELVQIFIKLSSAVEEIHKQNIIHCDINPSNVLFKNSLPKITDFGLSRLLSDNSEITETQQIKGTLQFLAPEQAAHRTKDGSKELTRSVDIYCLGGLIYYCLTGNPPWQKKNIAEIIQDIQIGNEVLPIHQFNNSIPTDLQTICEKCLRLDPGSRYKSALELKTDLLSFASGLPITARPRSLYERAYKEIFRNPFRYAFATSILLFLVSISFYFKNNELYAKKIQEEQYDKIQAQQKSNEEQTKRIQENYLAMANRAVDRGQLKEAITYFELSGELSTEQKLIFARALYGLTEFEKFNDKLKEIDIQLISEKSKAKYHLLIAEHLLADNIEKSREHIELALTINEGLELFEIEYAKGLLSAKPLDALEHFHKSISIKQNFLQSRQMAMLVLFSLGRIEETRLLGRNTRVLYQDDVTTAILTLISSSMLGDFSEKNTLIDIVQKQYPYKIAAFLDTIVPFLAVCNFDNFYTADSQKQNEILSKIQNPITIMSLAGSLDKMSFNIQNTKNLRLPPCIRPLFSFFLRRFEKCFGSDINKFTLLNISMNLDKFNKFDIEDKKDIRELIEDFDESFLLFIYGTSLEMPFPGQESTLEEREKFRNNVYDMALVFERAYRAKGSFFNIKTSCCDMAIVNYCLSGLEDKNNHLPSINSRLIRGKNLYIERRSNPFWYTKPLPEASFFSIPIIKLLRALGEYGLALDLLQTSKPNDKDKGKLKFWYHTKAFLDFDLGAYYSAIKEADNAMKCGYDDKNDSLKNLKKLAYDKLEIK